MAADFSEIEQELHARVARIAWCTVTTVDAKGRPRSRILHPMWEGSTAWILTGRHSFKAKHLANNPNVALSYWDQQHQQIYVEATAAWEDDPAEKERVWKMVASTPPPYGYDPTPFWRQGPTDPGFGLLKCSPRRVELWSLGEMVQGKPSQVWRA